MKYCVVSDAHANYPALKSVFDSVKSSVDGIIYLGDIIGLMGFPSETTDLLQTHSDYTLRGNHDIKVIDDNVGWVNDEDLSEFERSITHKYLSNSQKQWISSLECFQKVTEPSYSFLLSHGEPTIEKAHGIYESGLKKGDFVTYGAKYDVDFILIGHTHTQEALDCSSFGHDTIVLNPGTVGQRFTRSEGTAEYAIIDTEDHSYSLHTQQYNIQKVFDKLDELDVPKKWW